MASTRTIQTGMMVFTASFLVFGCVLVGYAVENVKHFKAYEALSSSAHKNTEASIFIGVAGGLLLLVSLPVILCGCWKNPHENRCKLFLVFLVLLVVIGLEVYGTALGYKTRDKIKDRFSDDVLKAIHESYGIKPEPSHALDTLQEKNSCCGWYNYTDWRDSRFAREVTNLNDSNNVPSSCCTQVSRQYGYCDINTRGCKKEVFEDFNEFIEQNFFGLAATPITTLVFLVPGALLLLLLIFTNKGR